MADNNTTTIYVLELRAHRIVFGAPVVEDLADRLAALKMRRRMLVTSLIFHRTLAR